MMPAIQWIKANVRVAEKICKGHHVNSKHIGKINMQNNSMIGHNRAPSDMEIMAEQFSERYENLLREVGDLIIRVNNAPKIIEDEKMADYFTVFSKNCHVKIKELETVRVLEKNPYLEKSRIVDGYFKTIQDKLENAKRILQKPLDTYLIEKARVEREARQAEAQRLREEADARAAEAVALAEANKGTQSEREMIKAVRTENAASEMEQAIQAAPMGAGGAHRSISGVTAALRTVWVGEVNDLSDIDLNKLKSFFTLAEVQKAVNGFVRAGGRELKGVHIYEKSETVVR
jgi:hypothetical protein